MKISISIILLNSALGYARPDLLGGLGSVVSNVVGDVTGLVAGITTDPHDFFTPIVNEVASLFAPAIHYNGPTKPLIPQPPQAPIPPPTAPGWWMADIKHQGVAPYQPDASYAVFRNVKDFGAVGDGVTDDTAAINLAISTGNRCAPGKCVATSKTPATIYFPPGTYLISSSIFQFYFTNIIGDPNDLPVLKATPDFKGFGLIDSNPYIGAALAYQATNVFYRQVRNIVFDITAIAPTEEATGLHWPTSQATSVQNCVFRMSEAPGVKHRGIFVDDGSGGFMSDLVFYGGINGAVFGNQQFTMRNLTFYNCINAVSFGGNWGWVFRNINVYNCSVGIDISTLGGNGAQTVGSIILIDSTLTNVKVGIKMARNATSQPDTGGSIAIENVQITNVRVAVQGFGNTTALAGTRGSSTIVAWGQGHSYTPNGPHVFQGPHDPFPRPASLTSDGNNFYERSKPQYESLPVTAFVSLRSEGAKGDGVTDDTKAINAAILKAQSSGKVLFVDAGTYKVTSTVYIPGGSKIVGEAYPVIMGAGKYFSDMNSPKAVVCVGHPGEFGYVEWSDMFIGTQGGTAGAIFIEWNLASPLGSPSGMWDVHVRAGGYAGSKQTTAECPKTPTEKNRINKDCIIGFMSMHVTKHASGLYMENAWLWTADHDIDDQNSTQITVYNGRGLLIESEIGGISLVGTAVEHHVLYEYQLVNTQNIWMGHIQTETAYYQPNPDASQPFKVDAHYSDPDFEAYCKDKTGNCGSGWGLRILNSQDILVYGAGLYSFFNNYSTDCLKDTVCQAQIFGIDEGGPANSYSLLGGNGGDSTVYLYNLNTIGTTSMINRQGQSVANFKDNINSFPDTIALFRTG